MSFGRLFRQSRIPTARTGGTSSAAAPSAQLLGSVPGKGGTLEYGIKHSRNPRQPKMVSVASLDWFGLGTDYRPHDVGFHGLQQRFAAAGIALEGPSLLQHTSRSSLGPGFIKWCNDRGVRRSQLDRDYLRQLIREYSAAEKSGPWDTISCKPLAGPSYFPKGSLQATRNGFVASPLVPARVVDDQRTKAASMGLVATCEVNDSSVGHVREKIVMMEVKGAKLDDERLVMKLQSPQKSKSSVWQDYTGSQKLQRMQAGSSGNVQHKKFEKLFDMLQ